MSHEDVLMMVAAIKSVAWAVQGVVWVLAVGIGIREFRQRRD